MVPFPSVTSSKKAKKLPKKKICPDTAGKAPKALGNSDR
jgi:hypothetical protein